MVVVAIIGLLSSVAVPNFKKYQAKAKVAEAKLQLSAIYTAEMAFYSDYNMYAACFRYMGYDPDAERANRYYATGIWFPNPRDPIAKASAVNSGLNTTACPGDGNAVDGTGPGAAKDDPAATFFYAGKGVGQTIANATLFDSGPGYFDSNGLGTQDIFAETYFYASAVGIISAGNVTAATASALSIDRDKKIDTNNPGF